jgi:hypothetical protein
MNAKLSVASDSSFNANVSFINFPTYTGSSNPTATNFVIKSYVDNSIQTNGTTLLAANNPWTGNNNFSKDVSMNSNLYVNRDASFNSKFFVASDVSLNSKLFVGTTTNMVGDVSMNSNLTVGGNVTIGNKLFASEIEATNLSIKGTMTYINVSQLDISDNLIRLNKNGVTVAGSGIEIESSGNTIGAFVKLDNTDKWTIMSPGQPQDYIVTKSRVDVIDASLIEVRSRLGQYSYDLANTTSIDRNVVLSNSTSSVTILGDASLNLRFTESCVTLLITSLTN